MLVIYTDGSAHPNPGPGGFGVVVTEDDKIITTYSKQFNYTTNNEMELKAILYSFLNYGSKTNPPTIISDSSYCINIFTNWMFNWEKKGWIKSDKRPPENLDIIKAYWEWYQEGYRVNFQQVKGHSGNKYNELADKLATGKVDKI